MYWKGHEKMCTLQCRRGIVKRRSQFNEIDKRDRYKRVPGMFRAAHEVRLNMKELSRWHSLSVYTAALLTEPARHRQKCRPTGVKIYFPACIFPLFFFFFKFIMFINLKPYNKNLVHNKDTWSDGRKLPDTNQFVSSEAFMKKRSKLAPWWQSWLLSLVKMPMKRGQAM